MVTTILKHKEAVKSAHAVKGMKALTGQVRQPKGDRARNLGRKPAADGTGGVSGDSFSEAAMYESAV